MKAKSILLAIAVAFCCAAEAVVYVKPGATGTGASWSDAADLEAAVAAVREGSAVTPIYVAKGVYYPSAMLRLNGYVQLYGGFAGASMDETPETRDLAANETIVSGDTKKNDRWELFCALTGTSEDTGELIIQDGKVFVPAFTNDYDTVAPLASTVGYSEDNLVRVISITNDTAIATACVVDGVTVQGGGWTAGKYANLTVDGCSCDYGGAISSGPGAASVVRNCRVVGCYGMYPCVYFAGGSAAVTPTCTNNTVAYSRSRFRGVLGTSSANVTLCLDDCDFVGNVRACDTGDQYGAACVHAESAMSFRDCRFVRNYNHFYRSNNESAICVSLGYTVNTDIHTCRFEKNSAYSTTGEMMPIVKCAWHSRKAYDCQFLSNRVTYVTSAASVTAAGCIGYSHEKFCIHNCVFSGNRLDVRATADNAVVTAAPIMAMRGSGETCIAMGNSMLLDNAVSVTATGADATVVKSRGMLAWCNVATCRHVSMFNCTAAGSDPAPDLVLYGSSASTVPSYVVNSVLWADGDTPRVVGTAENVVQVKSSIVRNASALPAESTSVTDTCEYDPDLLTIWTDGVPSLKIATRHAGNTCVYDVAQSGYRYAFGLPTATAASEWTVSSGGASSFKTPLIADIFGAERTSGAFVKGASQSLSPVNVTYTFDLGKRGVFDDTGLSTATLHLFTGDAVTIPAYTVNAGYTFRKWRDTVPAVAGDADATFKAYYWGPLIEIEAGDDLSEVATGAAAREDGAEIVAGAGDYPVSAAFALPTNVVLKGTGSRIVSSVKNAINQGTLPAGAGVSRVEGFTLTGGNVAAGAHKMSFTDCVFSNAAPSGTAAAIETTAALTLTGCSFLKNSCAVYGGNIPATTPVAVTNCVFRGNSGNENGTLINGGAGYVDIDGCTFEDNANTGAGRYLMTVGDSGGMCISRSSFVGNVASNATALIHYPNYSGPGYISNCVFRANRVVGDRGNNSSVCACLLYIQRNYHPITGTSFISNVIDRTEAATVSGVTEMRVQLVFTDYYNNLKNDTFVGNVVRATPTDPNVTPRTCLFAFEAGLYAGLANLTFKDNVTGDGDVYLRYNNGVTATFVNCLFTGGDGYVSINRGDGYNTKAYFFNSVVNGAPDDDWVIRTSCLAETPTFARRFSVENGLWSICLARDSAGGRGGIQTYYDAGGAFVFRDGSTWRQCQYPTGSYSVTEPLTPFADVNGRLPGRRTAMGARYDVQPAGLRVVVR